MKKIGEIINLQEGALGMSGQALPSEPSAQSMPLSQPKSQSITLANKSPKISECITSKVRLSKLLGMVFLGQKTYGTKPEDLAARDEYFEMMLQGYTFDQVQQAFHQYAKTKDDLPAPANIIQLIENPPVANYDNVVCACGKHYGMGINTPDRRAQSYAWHRCAGINYTGDKQAWLDSYEAEHGNVGE